MHVSSTREEIPLIQYRHVKKGEGQVAWTRPTTRMTDHETYPSPFLTCLCCDYRIPWLFCEYVPGFKRKLSIPLSIWSFHMDMDIFVGNKWSHSKFRSVTQICLLSVNTCRTHAGQQPPAVKFSTSIVPCGQSFSSSIGKQSTNLQFGQTGTWKVRNGWSICVVWGSEKCTFLHSACELNQDGRFSL